MAAHDEALRSYIKKHEASEFVAWLFNFTKLFFRSSPKPWVFRTFIAVELISFLIMFMYVASGATYGYYGDLPLYVKISMWVFCVPLLVVVLLRFTAIILNNIRIKRVCKELGISIEKYNSLIE